MRPRFGVAVAHQLRQRQHQGVAGVDQVAVAGAQALLQPLVDGQEVLVEQVGVVLGVLEPEGRLGPGEQLHDAERLGE